MCQLFRSEAEEGLASGEYGLNAENKQRQRILEPGAQRQS